MFLFDSSQMKRQKKKEMRSTYDGILLVSFGGPEGMDDVLPFLRNVVRGKNVPEERLLEVAEGYRRFGGVSPINAQNRELRERLMEELEDRGLDLPIYWGNRNWSPLIGEALQEAVHDRKRNLLAYVTSAYSSYSGCRQYREDIAQAQEELGSMAPRVDKIRAFFNHPKFIQVHALSCKKAFQEFPQDEQRSARLVFTAHSLPLSMAKTSRYEAQLKETCKLVSSELGLLRWDLAYQSRSGPPQVPWLEPDIRDLLERLQVEGVKSVVLSPIGFVSDHMEVLNDLDVQAKEKAQALGMHLVRAETPGSHPLFVSMIADLIEERLHPKSPRPALGEMGPSHDICPQDCCPKPEKTSRYS